MPSEPCTTARDRRSIRGFVRLKPGLDAHAPRHMPHTNMPPSREDDVRGHDPFVLSWGSFSCMKARMSSDMSSSFSHCSLYKVTGKRPKP